MWSEHCSYKSSKPLLFRGFPTKGSQRRQRTAELSCDRYRPGVTAPTRKDCHRRLRPDELRGPLRPAATWDEGHRPRRNVHDAVPRRRSGRGRRQRQRSGWVSTSRTSATYLHADLPRLAGRLLPGDRSGRARRRPGGGDAGCTTPRI